MERNFQLITCTWKIMLSSHNDKNIDTNISKVELQYNQFYQQICILILQRNEMLLIGTWIFLHWLPDSTCLWMVSDIIWIPEKLNLSTCGFKKIWRWWYWTETFRLWMVHWVGKRINTENFIILSISTCPLFSLKSLQNFSYAMSP